MTKKSEAEKVLEDVHRHLADLDISSGKDLAELDRCEPELCDEMGQLKVEGPGKKDGLAGSDDVELSKKKDKENWLISSKIQGVGQILKLLSEPVEAGNESGKSGTQSGAGGDSSAGQTKAGTSGENVFNKFPKPY